VSQCSLSNYLIPTLEAFHYQWSVQKVALEKPVPPLGLRPTSLHPKVGLLLHVIQRFGSPSTTKTVDYLPFVQVLGFVLPFFLW
jgi:hypothetical protein